MHYNIPCVCCEADVPAVLGGPEATHELDLSFGVETNFEVEKDFVAVISCHFGISFEAGINFEAGLH